MSWWLVRAFAWRFRWAIVLMMPAVGIAWLAAIAENLPAVPPVVLAFTSASLTFSAYWSRETRVLPFSRRELWRLAWCTSVLIPIVCLFLFRMTVMSLGAAFLHAALEFVYLGIAVAGMPLLMAGGASVHRSERLFNRGFFVVMLAWILTPFFIQTPQAFGAIPEWGLALFGLGTVGAITSLVRTPRSVGRRSPSVTNAPALRQRTPAAFDQLSGLRRLAPGQLGSALLLCAFVFAIEFIPFLFIAPPSSTGRLLDATGLLPFVPGRSNSEILLESGFGMFLAMYMSSGWKDWLRHLKVLPLSRWQLVALVSSAPAVNAAVFWLALVAVHLLSVGESPSELRSGLFFFILGVGTLLNALWIRRRSLAFVLLGPIIIGLPRASSMVDSPFGLAALGLILVVIALVINHRTVTMATSSSHAYQPQRVLFGMGIPETPR